MRQFYQAERERLASGRRGRRAVDAIRYVRNAGAMAGSGAGLLGERRAGAFRPVGTRRRSCHLSAEDVRWRGSVHARPRAASAWSSSRASCGETRGWSDAIDARDLRRGFTLTLLLLVAIVWVISLAPLVFIAASRQPSDAAADRRTRPTSPAATGRAGVPTASGRRSGHARSTRSTTWRSSCSRAASGSCI